MHIKLLKFADGERFPVLLDDDNSPIFKPTAYTVAMLRPSAGSYRTLLSQLGGLMVLYIWAQRNGIDIEGRFDGGNFLTLQEIMNLADDAKRLCKELREELEPAPAPAISRIINLEKHRMSANSRKALFVGPATAAIRLMAIRGYLDWLALQHIGKIGRRSDDFAILDAARQQMTGWLAARIPHGKKSKTGNIREGLSPEVQELLLESVAPSSPQNPWKSEFVRFRNQALVRLFLALGPRGGEGLILRVQDVDLRKSELLIRRAPDDFADPRLWEPNTKTLDRKIPLNEELTLILEDYILKHRSKLKGARKHPVLLVADRTGAPLSQSALSKIFRVLREKVPGLPDWLTCHVCRYTWNDNFSDLADREKTDEELEKRTRAYLMGWTFNSQMPAKYAKRHIKMKAAKASLDLQNKAFRKKGTQEDEN